MTVSSRASSALALLAILLTPGLAGAHGEDGLLTDTEEDMMDDPRYAPPSAGYTGPSRLPWLSYYQGTWLYGQFTETKLTGQLPRNVRGDGDWLVWEDGARGDIFLYSASARDGFYLTTDRAPQRNPAISDGTVVWEDYRDGPAHVYMYQIETGESKLVSSGPGNHKRPSIDHGLVAWEDDRNQTQDIWGAYITNLTAFPIAQSIDRESDPLVHDGTVYHRIYRFNVFDIVARDIATHRTFAVTNDAIINTAPFTNGEDVLFLSQAYDVAWTLQRYDVAEKRVRATTIHLQDTARTPASGDRVLQIARDVGYSQIVARNLTTGSTNFISGNLKLITDPHLDGRTAYLFVQTRQGIHLVTLEVSDFAFAKRPSLTVTSPISGSFWTRPVKVQGILRAGTTFSEPTTFTYRIDDGGPRAIPPSQAWDFTADPEGYAPGNHLITIRATFQEGPPVETSLTLAVPTTTSGIDVEKQAELYHKQAILYTYNRYIGSNAAAWIVILLALALLTLLVLRIFIFLRRRRNDHHVEYVRPD